jgi:hypothetical protein
VAEKKSALEKWGAYAAALTAILALIFLVFPNWKPESKEPHKLPEVNQARPIPPLATPLPGDIILGTWQEFLSDSAGSGWEYVGTFVVAKAEGVFTIGAREQRDAPHLINSIGIFDVRSDGTRWTFNSNLGSGRVTNFDLKRVSDTEFYGTISMGGKVINITKWEKVQ